MCGCHTFVFQLIEMCLLVCCYHTALAVAMEEEVDQHLLDPPQQMMKYLGNEKGIQGHQNSCYLDTTVFGLFALSDVFDDMFLRATEGAEGNKRTIKALLWKGIVNPLRK